MKTVDQKKKKILFVIISLVGGGAEKVLVRLITRLDKDKYNVRLVLFEQKLDFLHELDSSLRIDCLHKTSRWDFLNMIFKLKKIMREFTPDVVISLLDYANVITALALSFAKVRARLLLCEHNYPMRHPAVSFRAVIQRLKKYTYRKADNVIVVSKSIKKYYEKNLRLIPERIKVIHNPIPDEEVIEKSREKAEHPFLQDAQRRVIITVGRLEQVKRYDRLIRAFSRARKQQENLCLIILGKGSLEGELKALVKQLGEEEHINFVGFKQNPYAWIAKSEVLALSSEVEGFPNVLIEAMVCGVPVVSVDCKSGPSEIIKHQHNGLLVPEGDERLLAEALLTIIRDEKLRRKFAQTGKEFAAKFQVENILPQYEALF